MGVEIKTINLDSLVGSKLQKPSVDGVPLYTRVDNEIELADGVTLNKTSKWIKASKIKYNSPNNVRRLFITKEGIYVHLYKPVHGGNNNLEYVYSYKESVSKYIMQDAQGLISLRISKSGIGALSNKWVYSNIEEIYFDDIILRSIDIMNLGFGDLVKYYSNQLGKFGNSEPIKEITSRFLIKQARIADDTMRNRFPRLRVVAYISDLDKVYKAVKDLHITNSIENMKRYWFENTIVHDLMASHKIVVAKYETKIPRLNPKYSLRDGIYLYDKQVLSSYFSALEKRIYEYHKEMQSKVQDNSKNDLVNQVNNTKSSLEMQLDDIYVQEGINGVKKEIVVIFVGLPSSELIEAYNNMSEQGKLRYREAMRRDEVKK